MVNRIKRRIIIIGGVASGATCATRIRRLDEDSNIIMFEATRHIAFANCGLPYYIGGVIQNRDDLFIQDVEGLKKTYNIDVRINNEVIDIDVIKKSVKVLNVETLETYDEYYDKLVLATGAKSVKPDIEGIESKLVFTLRTILDVDNIKKVITNAKSCLVIGGGFIGVEVAENLINQGLKVTIVEATNQILNNFDYELAINICSYLKTKKVNIFTNKKIHKIIEVNEKVVVKIDDNSYTYDFIIFAGGVKPNNDLALKANLNVNFKGGVIVNEFMQTSNADIYAVGDVVEVVELVTKTSTMIPLASPANKQARVAASNICGVEDKYIATQGSSIIKIFDKVIAQTGISEKIAKRLELNYDKVYLFSNNHASYYPNTKSMLIKAIFENETGKILGVQIVGSDGVDKRCDVFGIAIRLGLNASDLTKLELCYAPPFNSVKDPINMVGCMIENVINKKIRNIHYNEISLLPKNDSVILLDVRTRNEYLKESIEGAINIPLDELRTNNDILDKNKTIYVYCLSGQRSYTACRILIQKGFEVYNLNGGIRLYKMMIK